MQKNKEFDVKPFSFTDFNQQKVVKSGSDFKPFEFSALTGESLNSEDISSDTIRAERQFEKKNNFKIDSVVRQSRGLNSQEESDIEARIQAEVQKRVEKIYQDAYQEGLEKGKEEAYAHAHQDFDSASASKIEQLAMAIESLGSHFEEVQQKNRKQIYDFVKKFTKWIVLKEIDEQLYLEKLFEKLLLELNARQNLIIKVDPQHFKEMPEVIKAVESRLGQLKNVRVELASELEHPGIILESENGIIDGSVEGIFQVIDKVFDSVVGHE